MAAVLFRSSGANPDLTFSPPPVTIFLWLSGNFLSSRVLGDGSCPNTLFLDAATTSNSDRPPDFSKRRKTLQVSTMDLVGLIPDADTRRRAGPCGRRVSTMLQPQSPKIGAPSCCKRQTIDTNQLHIRGHVSQLTAKYPHTDRRLSPLGFALFVLKNPSRLLLRLRRKSRWISANCWVSSHLTVLHVQFSGPGSEVDEQATKVPLSALSVSGRDRRCSCNFY